MKKVTAIISILFFAIVGPVFAEDQDFGVEKGMTTVGVQGSLSVSGSSGSDETITTGMIGLTLTSFLTNNWEVGVNALGALQSYDDGESGMLFGDLILNYNFNPASKTVWYLGGAVGGVMYGDDEVTGYGTAGGQVGCKIFSSENIFWNVELRNRMIFFDEETAYNNGLYFGLNAIF